MGGPAKNEEDRLRGPFRHSGLGGRPLRQRGLPASSGHDPVSRNRRLSTYQADAAEPYGTRSSTNCWISANRRIRSHGRCRHRRGRDLADVAGHRAAGARSGHQAGTGRPTTSWPPPCAYPDRFVGYAALLPAKGRWTRRKELERCVKELGFMGWKTHCNYGDILHRREAVLADPGQVRRAGRPHLPAPDHAEDQGVLDLRRGAGRSPFGFGVETALVMYRLILSGAFDAFPDSSWCWATTGSSCRSSWTGSTGPTFAPT